MIENHFGFRTTPFTRELPIRERFSLPFIDEQAKSIEDVIKSRMSALLISPPGTGKSVVLRTVVDRLPEARFRTSYFNLTRLSGRDLCREIARAIGARHAATYPALVRSVQERFEKNVSSDGIRPVLIFDDAHSMRPEGFELLKILTNFDMDSRLVVSFVLAGHPSLRKELYRDETEDVRQRITHFGELRLLSRDEAVNYIKHRINIIGSRTVPFDSETIEGLYELSRGNMRAIDTLALIALRRAAESGEQVVSQQHLHKARAEVWI